MLLEERKEAISTDRVDLPHNLLFKRNNKINQKPGFEESQDNRASRRGTPTVFEHSQGPRRTTNASQPFNCVNELWINRQIICNKQNYRLKTSREI